MDLKQEYKNITNKEGFLCSISIINNKLQFHFLNNNKIITYENSQKISEDEPYSKPGTIIEELNLDLIKSTPEQTLKLAQEELKKLNESSINHFIILNQNKIPTWNITFITNSYKTFNIKINAITNQILNQSLDQLIRS